MKLIATGNTAEVFEYEEDKVLKLFKAGYPLEQIQREFNNTVIMNRTCVHTPKPFEIVEHEGRHGIVFQKIIGVDLLSEYLKNPSDKKVAAEILVNLTDIQKKVLSEETTEGISYKNYLDWFGYDGSNLPDGNFICHGDLHPGNIIRTKDGELCLIDFMNVCRGPKEYDVARTYVLLTENNPAAKAVGKKYLELMEMSFLQIEPFLGAIQFCRKKEKL